LLVSHGAQLPHGASFANNEYILADGGLWVQSEMLGPLLGFLGAFFPTCRKPLAPRNQFARSRSLAPNLLGPLTLEVPKMRLDLPDTRLVRARPPMR
jgi:hypothetical protein